MSVEKMRKQLGRAEANRCGQSGCSRPGHNHWHYMQAPGMAEEIVIVGSAREGEIARHEQELSSRYVAGRQLGEIITAATSSFGRPTIEEVER